MRTSPLRLGVLIALTTMAFAGVAGLIAVLDADEAASAAGIGFGIAAAVFAAGGTVACALACLIRRRLELIALGGIIAAGAAIDLLVIAIWKDIGSEAYGKAVGIAFAWTLYALVILGLTLALGRPASERLMRGVQVLYGCAVGAAMLAGLLTTWLVATTGSVSLGPDAVGDDGLLRVLGVALVLLATLWFATLAASRMEWLSSEAEPPAATTA